MRRSARHCFYTGGLAALLALALLSAPAMAQEASAVGVESASTDKALSSDSDSGILFDPAGPRDFLGKAVVFGDFNNDGLDDTAIGVPGESVNGLFKAGAVRVSYGAVGGFRVIADQHWTQDSPGLADLAEAGDGFGAALAIADFNNDGFDDLAVGVAGEQLGGADDGGAVQVIYGAPGGLTAEGARLWTTVTDLQVVRARQAPRAHGGDSFGSSLAAADFDNDGFADLAVGVPGVSSVATGAVHVLYGAARGLSADRKQIWSRQSGGILGDAQPGDAFGASLAAGDFNNDGFADLAVGAPNAQVEGVSHAGSVNVIYGAPAGLWDHRNQIWTQSQALFADAPEQGDRFGSSLSVVDFNDDGFDDLAIHVPGEVLAEGMPAGAVETLYGASGGLSQELRPESASQKIPVGTAAETVVAEPPAPADPAARKATALQPKLAAGTSVVRINSGFMPADVVDAGGNVWSKDTNFTSGGIIGTGSVNGVTADLLPVMRRGRYGVYTDFSYTIPVTNGDYTLTLFFVEFRLTSQNQRIFDVIVNGVTVLDDFDILKEAQPLTLLEKTFPVTVTTSEINIKFNVAGTAHRGVVSAIQIEPANSLPDNTPPVRSNPMPVAPLPAGTTSSPFSLNTDENATCKWATTSTTFDLMANTFTGAGGTTHTAVLGGLTDGSTTTVFAHCKDSSGNETTTNFTITIHITDPMVNIDSPTGGAVVSGVVPVSFTATGYVGLVSSQLKVDGNPVGGPVAASPASWDTTAFSNGSHTLTIESSDAAGNMAGSPGVVVTVNNSTGGGGSTEFYLNTGRPNFDFVDSQGKTWVKDSSTNPFYNNGSHVCVGRGLIVPNGAAGPVEDERDRCAHFWQHGRNFSYKIPVDPGTYDITLYFAESQVSGVGQRVFDVSIDGLTAITGLDLVQTAGFRTLHIEEFKTDASDGSVDIDFAGRGGRSGIINGIAIKPSRADLEITKVLSGCIIAGTNATYTITVHNVGGLTAHNVKVTDTIPASLSLVSSTPSQGVCTAGPGPGPVAETCNLGAILGGGSATIDIVVSIPSNATGVLSNNANVTTSTLEPNLTNNTATDMTTVGARADLALTTLDTPDPVATSGQLIYTLDVTNNGPCQATNVVVNDTLPAGVTSIVTAGCTEGPNGTPTCSLGTIAAGGSAMYTITMNAPATPGDINNTATVSSHVTDPNSANDSVIETTTVLADPPPSSAGLPVWDHVLTRHPANPVITGSAMSASLVGDPYLLPLNGKLYMFFEASVGLGQIWMAESNDGVAWTNYRKISSVSQHLSHPEVYVHDGAVHAFYNYNGDGSIYHRSSPVDDIHNWGPESVVFVGDDENWHHLVEFTFVERDGSWYLLGITGDGTRQDQWIRGRVAPDLLSDWTASAEILPTPMLDVDDDPWLAGIVEITAVTIDERLLLLMGARKPGNGAQAMVTYEVTHLAPTGMQGEWLTDGYTFNRSASGWDSEHIHRAHVVPFKGQWIYAYDGKGPGSNWKIGIATAPID